eukprot:TRINITY_DN548_c0_g1_i12.p2 TRINITY_DN548_c0_g1~~TRINITY_DN548_c0_g1_i12.p2  ORF type:complete len:105 (-),score=13.22 TRINITY_DN548_c0_g1_i12:17-331(-)
MTEQEGVERFNSRPFGITITVKNPLQEVVHTRTYNPTSRFAITSTGGGEYEMCFRSNTTTWYNQIKWRMDLVFHTGVEAQDYQDLAENEHLSQIEVAVCNLLFQ